MFDIIELKNKIIKGYLIDKEEALKLFDVPLDELTEMANEIRKHFCGNKFDVCTIINVKSGECSEDCTFCAQSSHYNTKIDKYPLMDNEKLKKLSLDLLDSGIKRISYVSSGRTISDKEFNDIIDIIEELCNNYDLNICVSLGLLNVNQIHRLKEAGVSRIHCNLESSENYFPNVCTTHNFSDKTDNIENINSEEILVCSGGIFGLGENFEDRIDLAFKLRELNSKSIPINILNPIPGTPVENNKILSNEEVCRIIAIFRFINPEAYIRMAGGRNLIEDHGRKAFMSGSNSAILGNMLTTLGVSLEEDYKMIKELGYEISYSIDY